MACIGKFNYIAKHKGVVNFKEGDILVLDKISGSDLKWVSGINLSTGEEGIFPRDYTKYDPSSNSEFPTPMQNTRNNHKSFKVNSVRLSKQVTKLLNFSAILEDFEEDKILKERIPQKPQKNVEVKYLTSSIIRNSTKKLPLFPFYKDNFMKHYTKENKWEERLIVIYDHYLHIYNPYNNDEKQDNTKNSNHNEERRKTIKKIKRLNNDNYKNIKPKLANFNLGEPEIKLDLFDMFHIKQLQLLIQSKQQQLGPAFEIIFEKRRHFFKCDNQKQLDEWIYLLKLVKSFFYIVMDLESNYSQIPLLKKKLKYLRVIKKKFENLSDSIRKYFQKNDEKGKKRSRGSIINSNLNFNKKRIRWVDGSILGVEKFQDLLINKMIKLKKRNGDKRSQMLILKDYNSVSENELSIKKDDLVSIVEAHQDEWWLGEVNGKIGYFPPEYGCLLVIDKIKIPKFLKDNNKNRNRRNFNMNQNNNYNKNENNGSFYEKQLILNWNKKYNILSMIGIQTSGPLYKFDLEGKSKNKWRKRFFLLIDNYFQYFTNDELPEPKLILNLNEIEKLSNLSEKIERDHSFSITHPKNSLILAAKNELFFTKWTKSIHLALNTIQSEKKIKFKMIKKQKAIIQTLLGYLTNKIEINSEKMKNLKNNNNKNENNNNKNENNNNSSNVLIKKEIDLNKLRKKIFFKTKITILQSFKKQYLGIMARLQFPNINDKEVAYSIESHKEIILKEELTFNSGEWFQLINEFDENYIQVDNGEKIGLVLRSKLIIIDVPNNDQVFINKEINNNINNTNNNNINSNNNSNNNSNITTTTTTTTNNNIINNNNAKTQLNDIENEYSIINEKDIKNIEKNINKEFLIKNEKETNSNNNSHPQITHKRSRRGTTRMVQNLLNKLELEEKSGESFPIKYEGYLKILKGKKFVKKYFRLKSWYLGYYDSKDIPITNLPNGAIDLRTVISCELVEQGKNLKKNQVKLKIKGGITQTLQEIDTHQINNWVKIFRLCELFQKLSKPVILINESDEERDTKTIEKHFSILINYIEETIDKTINSSNSNTNNNSNKLSNEKNKKTNTSTSISIKSFLKRKIGNKYQLQQQQQQKQQKQKRKEIEELKINRKFLALCKTWRQKLLQKVSRLKIKDPKDNRMRIYCLKNHQANPNSNGLSFKKGDWLILIRKPLQGVLKAQKIANNNDEEEGGGGGDYDELNQNQKEEGNKIGEVLFAHIELVKPCSSETFKMIKNDQLNNNNENENEENDKDLKLKAIGKIISQNGGSSQKIETVEELIHEKSFYFKKLLNNTEFNLNFQKENNNNNNNNNNSNNNNNEFLNKLPLFVEGKILIEKKLGTNKWFNRILVIIDWYIVIFNKSSLIKIYDLRKLNSVEKCNDIIDYQWSFILYIGNKEFRFVLDNEEKYQKWLNVFTIIKTVIFLLNPLQFQKFYLNRSKYIKMIKWLEEGIQFESINQINLFSENKDKSNIQEKHENVKKKILLLQNWRQYFLSRLLRLYIISQNKNPNNQRNNNNNNNNNTINEKNNEKENEEQIEQLFNLLNDHRKRVFTLQIYKSNNELIFKENEFYLLVNQKGSTLEIEIKKDLIKKIPSGKVEIIIPEKIKFEKEFPNISKKSIQKITELKNKKEKLFTKSINSDITNNNTNNSLGDNNNNNSNNNNNKNDNNNKKNENNNNKLAHDLIERLKNYYNFENNPLLFNKLFSNITFLSMQEPLSLYDLNIINRNDSINISGKLIKEWKKHLEMPLNFPVSYQNHVYIRYRRKGKLIRRWAVIRAWIFRIHKSMDEEKTMRIIDLRTIVRFQKSIKKNKKFRIILKNKLNKTDKLYFHNEIDMNNWFECFNAVKNFFYFLKPINEMKNENDKIKIEILNRIYIWIQDSIIEVEKNLAIQENLLNLYSNFEDVDINNYDPQLSKQIHHIQRRMNLLWLWRLRILSKICKIKFNKKINLSNIKAFGFVHTSFNQGEDYDHYERLKTKKKKEKEKEKREKKEKEEGEEKGEEKGKGKEKGEGKEKENQIQIWNDSEESEKKTYLNINEGEWIIFEELPNIFENYNNENNYKNLPKELMGINEQTNQRGFINLTNICLITRNDLKMNLIFDLNNINLKKQNEENNNKNNKKINNIPVYKKGWLLFNKSTIVGSKWQKRWCVLQNSKLYIYTNPDDLGPILTEDLQNMISIKPLSVEKNIPSYKFLPIQYKTNVFEIITNNEKRSLKFACGRNSIRFDWITYIENVKNFIEISRPPSKIGYNARKRERLFSELKSWIELKIKNYQNEIKAMKSMFLLYRSKNNNNQDINQLTEVEENIEELQKRIISLSDWRLQILQRLLRFRIKDPKDYTVKAYMIKTITIEEQDLDLGEREWLNIIEEFETQKQTKVEKRGKIVLIDNSCFIKVVPSKPEKFMEDLNNSNNSSSNNSNNNNNNNNNRNGVDEFDDENKDLEEELKSNENKIKFCELIIKNQASFTKSLISNIDITDADVLTKNLIIIFENNNMLMPIIEIAIRLEVDNTKVQSTLFRTNSVASKMMSHWAKSIGKDYLKNILGDVVQEIISNKNPIEIDPFKIPEKQLVQNKSNLEHIVKKTLSSICGSITNCPLVIREIASKLWAITSEKFPNAKYTALAGFMFLRFISPALVVPESIGIVKKSVNRESRKGLILVSKLIQNIANNTHLKEESLFFLNYLVDDSHQEMISFLDQLAEPVYIVKSLADSKDFLILKKVIDSGNKNNVSFIGCKGRKLNKNLSHLKKNQLQTSSIKKNFFLEKFKISQVDLDIAIEKIFKLLTIEKLKLKIFDDLKNNQDLIKQIKLLFPEKKIENNKKNEIDDKKEK
ncbi:ras gtpase-activating protein [Anaeramoeba flamelloides]|uniref:Ras gtpase-activating protein n=1 Tax=Anaeramoeba flamelloides TaxID=1746091 RepID=A0ABQ8XPX0_9EUKA|nr:ras gtpase-activating protein [Anaeramoeba flamelloides]